MFSLRKYFIIILSVLVVLSALSCKKDSAPTDAPLIITKITGTVTNKVSGATIQGAQVTTTPVTSTVSTDVNGKYEFEVPKAGTYVVSASKSGYKDVQLSVTATEGNTAKADIQMEELTGQLSVSPVFLDLGTSNNQATFAISNGTGIGTINYTINKNAGWISLSELAGSITTNTKIITLTADRTQLTYGTFNDVITVNSNVGNAIVNVQIVKQNPNSPQLTISPISLDFGSSQSELNVTMSNTGTGTINWTANSTDGWISVIPSSGSITNTSVTTTIRVNRSGLLPNTFNGSVTFSSNGGNQTLGAKMTIPTTPILGINPNTLSFSATDTQKTIQVTNSGSGTLNWSVASDQNWLTTSPVQGTNSSVVNVNVNKSNLSAGNYSGALTFISNGGNAQADISIVVPAPQPPDAVTLLTPTNISANSLRLNWTASSASDFASYKIYQSTSSNVSESSTLVATVTNSGTTNYTVTGLAGSSTYYYRVYVVNSKGVSAGSNTISASTTRQLASWVSTLTLSGYSSSYLGSNSLACLSDNNVWLGNYSAIWHYDGTTWSKDFTTTNGDYIFSIKFLSANLGWAVSDGGVYMYNGSSWTKLAGSPAGYDVLPSSASDIWVSGSGKISHYDGTSWSTFTVTANSIVSMYKLASNNIWAMDGYGKIFKYNGVGWASIGNVSSSSNSSFEKIIAFSNSDVWVNCLSVSSGTATQSGLWHYDGTTWIPNYKSTDISYLSRYAFDMVSSAEGWSTKIGGGFSYYDGNGWKDVASPISNTIYCVKMFNQKSGWAIGSGGEVLRYIEP